MRQERGTCYDSPVVRLGPILTASSLAGAFLGCGSPPERVLMSLTVGAAAEVRNVVRLDVRLTSSEGDTHDESFTPGSVYFDFPWGAPPFQVVGLIGLTSLLVTALDAQQEVVGLGGTALELEDEVASAVVFLLPLPDDECGDGIVSGPEQCDDGNNTDGDGCSGVCILELVCSNGILDPGEDCEGDDLAGATCQSLGFGGGVLGCRLECVFDTTGCTTPSCDFALVSDEAQLSDPVITTLLADAGHTFATYENNAPGGVYTEDLTLVQSHDAVILHKHDRALSVAEVTVLSAYVDLGGRLLVTGHHALDSPVDIPFADLVGCTSPGAGPMSAALVVVTATHPIATGPAEAFAELATLTAAAAEHDRCDPGPGALELIEVSGTAKLLVRDDVGPGGGRVVYWNGNGGGSGLLADWVGLGGSVQELRNLFLNVIDHLCRP